MSDIWDDENDGEDIEIVDEDELLEDDGLVLVDDDTVDAPPA